MPVLDVSQRNLSAPFVGETEFIDPENVQEHVKIYIHIATPLFVDTKLQVSKRTAQGLRAGKCGPPMMKYFKNTIFRDRNDDVDK